MKAILILMLTLVSVQAICAQRTDGGDAKTKAETVSEKRIGEKLIGTWSLVLVDNILPDGRRTKPYGENPVGLLMFDGKGNYTLQILAANRVKFASGDKTKGTSEEDKSLVLGSNSHFGKYFVNAADNTITFMIEHAFFPNWEGAEQKRTFTLSAKEFRYTVPTTTNGANVSGEVVWKRVN
jgi:hypothetical protein